MDQRLLSQRKSRKSYPQDKNVFHNLNLKLARNDLLLAGLRVADAIIDDVCLSMLFFNSIYLSCDLFKIKYLRLLRLHHLMSAN